MEYQAGGGGGIRLDPHFPHIFKIVDFSNPRSSYFSNPREEVAILASSFSSFLPIKGPIIHLFSNYLL